MTETVPRAQYGWCRPDGRGADLTVLPSDLGWTEVIPHPSHAKASLVRTRTHPLVPVTFTVQQIAPKPYLMLSLLLSGAHRAIHPDMPEQALTAGRWRFLKMAGSEDRSLYDNLTGTTNEVVTLKLTANWLEAVLEGQHAPQIVQDFLAGNFDPAAGDSAISATLSRILMQIEANPYQGAMARLYVEGKIHEMLAETFTLAADRDLTPAWQDLRRGRRAAFAARDMLLDDPFNPPTLEGLARGVGVSQRRLTDLFRKEFGATPLQCLARWRLDKAHILLMQGELSVKQVAHLAGYAHVSSFTHAFTRRFGNPPRRRS